MKMLKRKVLNLMTILSLLAIIAVASPAYAATLNDLYKQKQDIQNSMSAKNQQINNLQDMIGSLDTQTAATQQQLNITNQIINLTNQQIMETQGEIDQKQKELDQKKADLNETVITYYENGDPSTLEVIVSANNLSDAIDKSQYMQSLSDQINNQAQAIKKTKEDLQTKKDDLQKKEIDLESQKSSIVDQQRNLKIQADAKNKLLSQTKNEQSQLKADMDNVSSAIYAERQKLGGYTSGGTGGYPYSGDGVDPWGFYYRQCTSYAAWYFNVIEGKSWYSFRHSGIDRSSNGGDWADLGAYQGYSVSDNPRPGAIASWPAGGIFGGYGHVAIVQSVNSNGTINVSEYNWIPYSYDERNNVSPGGARFIY